MSSRAQLQTHSSQPQEEEKYNHFISNQDWQHHYLSPHQIKSGLSRALNRSHTIASPIPPPISQSDLHQIILNHLVSEGHRDVAAAFEKESSCKSSIPLASIDKRMSVRDALQKGHIKEAIQLIHEAEPLLLEREPSLAFALHAQQCCELIRLHSIDDALTFAQQSLAQHAQSSAQHLQHMEQVMTLLVFHTPDDSVTSGNSHPLLHLDRRSELASRVNAAILSCQSSCEDALLGLILKRIAYLQQRAETNHKISFPVMSLSGANFGSLRPVVLPDQKSERDSASSCCTFHSSATDPLVNPHIDQDDDDEESYENSDEPSDDDAEMT